MWDVNRLPDCVLPFYVPLFVTAFFTGMRAGEMSALKWSKVDFFRSIINKDFINKIYYLKYFHK